MRALRFLSIIVGLVIGLSAISFCYADSGGWLEGRGLAVRPVNGIARELGGRSWFLYAIYRGGLVEDGVEFWNKRDEAVKVIVEAVDAELANGAFALKGPEFVGGGYMGRWIHFGDEGGVVTVGPGEKKIFRFLVRVPLGASNGDYWGGITVREVKERESVSQNRVALWRVGVRMMVRVSRSDKSVTIQYLPQAGGQVVYYPELTLFLRRIFRFLPAPFGRG